MLLVAACASSSSGTPGTTPAPPAAVTQAPQPTASGALAPVPTIAAPTAPARTPVASNEPVAFASDDGVTLRGHVFGSNAPKRRFVVFAHGSDADQTSWQALAGELAAQGIAALTFDFRGYGESAGARDLSRADRDLEAALRFVKSRDYPLVYIVGAGEGGTAALKVAARNDLAGVVTVSTAPEGSGLDARPDLPRITARKLFLASGIESQPALDALYQPAPEPRQQLLCDGSGRGAALIAASAPCKQSLLEFISR